MISIFDIEIFDFEKEFGLFDKNIFDKNIFDITLDLGLFDAGHTAVSVSIHGQELTTELGTITVIGQPKIIGDGAGRLRKQKITRQPICVEVAVPVSGFMIKMSLGIVLAEAKVNEEDEIMAILLTL
jgi:hypothetical protein